MDHDSLYESDICTWAEQQATALRGLAARGDLPNELDLLNIVEEIMDVGNSHLNAVSSFIRLILSHVILIAADTDAEAVPRWTREIATFHAELEQRYQRGMRQRIDMDVLWRRAGYEAHVKLTTWHRATGLMDVSEIRARLVAPCLFSIADLTNDELDIAHLVERVRTLLSDG